MNLERLARVAMASVPGLRPAIWSAERFVRTRFGKVADSDFAMLRHFRLDANEFAIDAGANRGKSIDAVRQVWPDTNIIAFEPHPQVAAYTQRLFRRDDRTDVRAAGLGAETGSFPLFLPVYQGYEYFALASFDREEARGWLNEKRLPGFDAGALVLAEIACPIATIDDLAIKCGFLKLDVQGTERDVIRGGARTIMANEPLILMENNLNYLSPSELLDNGWQRFAREGGRLVPGKMGEGNTFYATPGRIGRSLVDRSILAE